MAELSKRLQAVADLVTPGMRLVDVGTDHAYIPIYLTQNGLVPSAIAMDINKGPLERADTHILEHGLDGKIVTRLSDGLVNLKMEEADKNQKLKGTDPAAAVRACESPPLSGRT